MHRLEPISVFKARGEGLSILRLWRSPLRTVARYRNSVHFLQPCRRVHPPPAAPHHSRREPCARLSTIRPQSNSSWRSTLSAQLESRSLASRKPVCSPTCLVLCHRQSCRRHCRGGRHPVPLPPLQIFTFPSSSLPSSSYPSIHPASPAPLFPLFPRIILRTFNVN